MRSALILAGGESRRFGGRKALVKIAGIPLIRRVADAMAALANETIVSVEGPEGEATIRSILPRVAFVHDGRPHRGPIEGFRQGFRVARGDLVLVAPCDAPFLRPPLYRLLLKVLGDHDVAVPKLEVLDPVRAVYRRDSVLEVLDTPLFVRSPSALVDRLDYVSVGLDQLREADPDLLSFVDVNTHPNLDEVLQRPRRRRDPRDKG